MNDNETYRWPRDRSLIPAPFSHQYETTAFMICNPHSYVLNDIGTGKTMSALWAADFLMEMGLGHRALVVAPLSTLERVWGDALFINFTHRKFSVLHGSAQRRKTLLAQPRDFYIVNHDGVGVIKAELLARPDIDIMIIDELAVYRNRQTGKWKVLDALLYGAQGGPKPWVWGLTGTPIPNSPEDAYGQCKLITPTTVPRFFTQFRNMVMSHESTYIWVPRPEATGIVQRVMRPAIRFARDTCLDLPPLVFSTRDVELSTDQKTHYKAVAKELHTEINGAKITALNAGIALSKLLQIAGGTVYDTDGSPHDLDTGSRLETLMETVEQAGGKILVFVPFTAMTAMIASALSKFWETAIITGDTPVKERNEVFSRFEDKTSSLEIIVAHPGTMAHGLTLVAASTIVWWTAIDSNDTYSQACGRITRPGQKHTACVINLAGSAVERRMYKRLVERQTTQGALLEMVERGESLI